MKKILGILFLSLLLGGSSFAGVEEVLKEIKKNKDLVMGFKNVKFFNRKSYWRWLQQLNFNL